MPDEIQPERGARRAADGDDPTSSTIGSVPGGARRSVTPDWDVTEDWDEDELVHEQEPIGAPSASEQAAVDVRTEASGEPTPQATPRWDGSAVTSSGWRPVVRPATPADDHDAFRPPRDDSDTVVIKRGDIADALAATAVSTPALSVQAAAAEPEGEAEAPEPEPKPQPSPAPEEPAEAPVLTASERLARMRGNRSDGATSTERPSKLPGWLLPVAAVLALAVLVAAGVTWFNRRPAGVASTSPTPSASSSTPPVLSDADLIGVADANLAQVADWQVESTTSPIPDTLARPLCLAAAPNLPSTSGSFQRKLVAGPAAMIHRAESYATAADASAVMALRKTQLGRCANVPVYLTGGATVSGLGDEAVAITAVVQDPTQIMHTVMLVRTGTVVEVVDLYQPTTATPVDKLAAPLAAVVGRQCTRAAGTCVTTPAVKPGPPPSGGVAGWLTVSDLPRVNPGLGRWTTNDPTTTVQVISSQCENVTFASVPGPTQRKQRTYLLTEDNVPKGFGMDEVILDFATPADAAAFTKTLVDNINGCTGRVSTAKLGNTATFTGTGAGGEAISGYWRVISQPTSATDTATFRVAVASVDKRVVYLLLTPSGTFDLPDQAWQAVAVRAAERATQQA